MWENPIYRRISADFESFKYMHYTVVFNINIATNNYITLEWTVLILFDRFAVQPQIVHNIIYYYSSQGNQNISGAQWCAEYTIFSLLLINDWYIFFLLISPGVYRTSEF